MTSVSTLAPQPSLRDLLGRRRGPSVAYSLSDAEALLLQGYAGLRERARQIRAGYRRELTGAAQALAQFVAVEH